MVTLHIYFEIPQGRQTEFEDLYWKHYVPAITKQEGFISTALIRSLDGATDPVVDYEIDIHFTNEDLRLQWAEGADHAAVWPKMESVAASVSWKGYLVLDA